MTETCTILEKGEYSLLIAEEMKDIVAVTEDFINFKVPKEIVSSPSGSIIYFDKRIDSLFKKANSKVIFCIVTTRPFSTPTDYTKYFLK